MIQPEERVTGMPQKKGGRTVIGIVCAVLCECLYGTAFLFTKQATDEVSMLTLLSWRFFLAFVLMSVPVLPGLVKVHYKGKKIGKLLLLSALFPVLYFIGETAGVKMTTAAESGTIISCIPVASLLASTLLLKKKPSKLQIIGVCVTMTGVLITVLGVGITASLSVVGYLMLLTAVITYALYCVIVEGATEFTDVEITYAMLAVGCAVFTAAALAEGLIRGTMNELVTAPFRSANLLKAVLYESIGCSIGAFFMNNVAISNIGVNRTSSFVGLSTVFSILSGVIILHEAFTPVQIVGAAVIVAGVYIANGRVRPRTQETADRQA